MFIQNGMLQPWLDVRGLGDATQARSCRLCCHACLRLPLLSARGPAVAKSCIVFH